MRVVIADDHQLILDGLSQAIQDKYEEAIIFKAIQKSQLDYFLLDQPIDVLVLDVKYGKYNAKDFIREIKQMYPKLKILILSSVDDRFSLEQILNMGVNGYVVKSDSIVDILNALEKIIGGDTYFSAEVKRKIEGDSENEIVLTRREKEVLSVILEEKSIKEIAEVLHISEKTVEMHRSNLFIKLGVKNITGLVKKTILLGLLEE